MIKGKTSFWLMIILFSIIIMTVVTNGENSGEIVKEMSGTMGIMMAQKHAAGASISDVFNTNWLHQSQDMAGHHELPPVIKFLDLTSFQAMMLILPLMAGAMTVMVILWL